MTKSTAKVLSITLCLLLALSAVAVALLGFGSEVIASAEGGIAAPVASAPTFTVIDGKNKGSGSNGHDYLDVFDGDTGTKYCIDITLTPYITFRASEVATVVTGYKLFTGNDTKPDHTGRNPKAWKLQGSLDNEHWTDIHTVADDDKLPTVENKAGYLYEFENTTPYWYYKITFTERQGTTGDDYNLMQISEMEFVATAPVVEVASAQEFVSAVEAGSNIKLVADITLTADIDIYQKSASVDLNGHVIRGKKIIMYGAALVSSILRLRDSNPTATHPGTSLPLGGVVQSELKLMRKDDDENYTKGKAYLYADGGTVTSTLGFGTGNARVEYTGGITTIFMGGVSGTSAHINAGFYYGEVVSSNADIPFKTQSKKVVFKNGDTTYATQFLKSGDKATMPINPTKEGYTFVKWYNSANNNDFNSASTVTDDCTIKPMWLKEVSTLDALQSEINNGNSVKLMADITLTSDLSVNGGKNIILDLNGHVISGNKKLNGTGNGGKSNPGPSTKLTIIDSNPTATHQDASLPIGGCINVDVSVTASSPTTGAVGPFHLHANGGTIKKVHCASYACYIFWSGGNKPSTIGAVTGSSDGGAKPTVCGGLFYNAQVVINSSATKVTYKSDGEVYAVLAINGFTSF